MKARQPLVATLRAAHLRLGLAAVGVLGLMLTLLSVLTLRTYVDQNLTLVARSISYTAEAAAVFGDADAAREALALIGTREGLLRAEIRDAQGGVLARYDAPPPAVAHARPLGGLAERLAPTARAAIVAHDRVVGEVVVAGNGTVYLSFMVKVLATIAVCMAVVAAFVSLLSRRIDRELVQPLRTLAALTRRARLERGGGLRAPPASVREIHELGEDFNALLAEVEHREASLVATHDTLRTANESLSYLAFHDHLTGLPNRACFRDRAGALLQAQRGGTGRAALLFVDCDRFKEINDRLGHAAGDALLVTVAQRLRAATRDSDVVARIGGDEFAVLLTSVRGAADAARVAAKITAALAEPIDAPTHGTLVASASIGIALAPDHGNVVEPLMAAADAAMYRAKARGGGAVALFDADVDDVLSPPVAA